MAVLVLAVQAGKAGAAHLFVPSAEGVIAAVGVVAVLKVELQQIVVILAEVHQGVHLLGGQGALVDRRAGAVHHIGPVAGDGGNQSGWLPAAGVFDGRPGPPGAQNEFAPRGLHPANGGLHRRRAAFPQRGPGCCRNRWQVICTAWFPHFWLKPLKSRITSPASTSPAAEGTKATEPGRAFWVCRAGPVRRQARLLPFFLCNGGQGRAPWSRPPSDDRRPVCGTRPASPAPAGRPTSRRGRTTSKRLGSSLLPAPMEQMMGTPAAFACMTRDSLPVTVSMASTT